MILANIEIPEDVLHIIGTLNKSSFEAYIVGGCVRDCLMGRQPNDWDITTNAKPEEVKSLFDKTIDTGLKHGTVSIPLNDQNYEVTTYRVDGRYTDHRRPESVKFTADLREDLCRRDFTINALAYHPSRGCIDFFGGIEDIRKRIIRAVGNPDERFNEDALRMLRAIRFSSQLGFEIEAQTLQSVKLHAQLIQKISSERIHVELTKTLISRHPLKFVLLHETGLLHYIIPEFETCFDTVQNHPYHIYNVALHSLHGVEYIEDKPHLRWAMLLHDIGKPYTRTIDDKGIDHFYGHAHKSVFLANKIFKRLKFDNKSIDRICRLIEHHDRTIEPTHKSVRRAVKVLGDDIFEDLLKIKQADWMSQNPDYLKIRMDKLENLISIYFDIKANNHCTNLKALAINGDDLIEMGFKPGKEIKIILEKLLDMVIENPGLNERDKLIKVLNSTTLHNN